MIRNGYQLLWTDYKILCTGYQLYVTGYQLLKNAYHLLLAEYYLLCSGYIISQFCVKTISISQVNSEIQYLETLKSLAKLFEIEIPSRWQVALVSMPTCQPQIRNRAGLPVALKHLLQSAFTTRREEVGLWQKDPDFCSFIHIFTSTTSVYLNPKKSFIYHDHGVVPTFMKTFKHS